MKKIFFTILTVVGMMASCSDETSLYGGSNGDMPINISAEYPVKGVSSRATDNGFLNGDAIGLYIVDYNSDGTPGELLMKGNRADNVRFEYDGAKWTANRQLYWANKNTPADFYGYYPFNAAVQDATAHDFSVYANQDGTTAGKSNYEQSDLLWTKAEKVQPTDECIPLTYQHLMAGVTVELQMGTGFEAAEWAELEKIVLIDNVVTGSTVNLQTGKVTAKDGAKTDVIKPYIYNNVWRAVVVPQTIVARTRVLNITVDGKSYELVKDVAVDFVGGKMHNFTVTVNKNTATGDLTFKLTSDDIVAWIDDADLHDGLVRQYVVVDVPVAGTLSQVLASRRMDAGNVTALKVTGNINHCDMLFMGQQMKRLENLNLAKVTLCADEHQEAGVLTGFADHKCLYHIVFPEKGLKMIGDEAFRLAGLSGSLVIPEGVEVIGNSAFGNNIQVNNPNIGSINSKLYGILTLPTTLKRIEPFAFFYQNFSGELILPDGLEYMNGDHLCEYVYDAFLGCTFSGTLNLPSSLKGSIVAPSGNFSGNVTIPAGVTSFDVSNSLNTNNSISDVRSTFDGGTLELEEGITDLNILGCGFAGELILPASIRKLKDGALAGNKFNKIILSDNIRSLGTYGMAYNEYLTSVVLSKGMAAIPVCCFRNCYALQSITIPDNIVLIGKGAFENCAGIGSIVCEGTEPPACGKDAFLGVNKDNFTVEVPKGCVDKYKEAEGWKEFKRIAEYSDFVCRPAQANALNKAHSENLVLNAEGAWTVKSKPDWISLSSESGNGKTELNLTFSTLNHGEGNRSDKIVFEMDGHETSCTVSQYDYQYEEDGCLTLQTHTQGNGIDVVFMGDGWDGESISKGEYLDLVKKQVEYFFGVEPYKSHRDYFNVYVIFPLSQEKGVNTMYTYVNNRFGTLYGFDGRECVSSQLLTETDEVFKYAVVHSPLTEENSWKAQLILVPNSDVYEGVTYYGDNNEALSLCPPSNRPYPQDTRGVIQHEAGGHGFGKLGDESVSMKNMSFEKYWASPKILAEIEDYHDRGWMQNLATSSKMSQLPWKDFVYDTRYSDQVDVFEGGYGYMRGVFRSENNSCMNYGIPYFNAISRYNIMRRIIEHGGGTFTDEYFYAHDSNKWGDSDGQTRSGASHASLRGNAITNSNMHRAPQKVSAKKMGDRVRRIIKELKNKKH